MSLNGHVFRFYYPRAAAYALFFLAYPLWLVLTAAVVIGGTYTIWATLSSRFYSNLIPALVFAPLTGFCLYVAWRLGKTRAALFTEYLVDDSGIRIRPPTGQTVHVAWGDITTVLFRTGAAEVDLLSARFPAPIFLTAMGLNWTTSGIPRLQLNSAAAFIRDRVSCPIVERWY